MAEVKTAPVKASFAASKAEFWDEDMRTRVPGAILRCSQEEAPTTDGSEFWYYSCPCGCGAPGRLRVKAGSKPENSPSWNWAGGTDAPVLHPSVNHIGHWHGWLGGSSGQTPGWWVTA